MLDQVYADRLRQTLQDVKDNPEHWNQEFWHCGTTHCFAGFAELREIRKNMTMIKALNVNTDNKGLDMNIINNEYFGISIDSWNTLINGNNTLDQLCFIVENLIENDGNIRIKYQNNFKSQDLFEGIDLRGADLSYSNFSGMNFRRAILTNANIDYCNFSKADLTDASMVGVQARNVNFIEAYLNYVELDESDLRNSDFTNARMRYLSTYEANMDNTIR